MDGGKRETERQRAIEIERKRERNRPQKNAQHFFVIYKESANWVKWKIWTALHKISNVARCNQYVSRYVYAIFSTRMLIKFTHSFLSQFSTNWKQYTSINSCIFSLARSCIHINHKNRSIHQANSCQNSIASRSYCKRNVVHTAPFDMLFAVFFFFARKTSGIVRKKQQQKPDQFTTKSMLTPVIALFQRNSFVVFLVAASQAIYLLHICLRFTADFVLANEHECRASASRTELVLGFGSKQWRRINAKQLPNIKYTCSAHYLLNVSRQINRSICIRRLLYDKSTTQWWFMLGSMNLKWLKLW